MLVQFSIENFLSFDEEQVFSMVAGSGDQHTRHLIPNTPHKGKALLRGAAIYGANASGKSNLVQAIRFAQNLILQGTRITQVIPTLPFKLDADTNRPSKFEFIIKAQGVLYNYGFRLQASQILEEWLFATPHAQEVLYFERSRLPSGTEHFQFGNALTGRIKKQTQFLDFIAQGTRPNQLFLTEAIDRNVSELLPLFQWFQNSCLILSAEATSRDVEGRAHTNQEFIGFLSRFLCLTDTGIQAVTTKEVPFDFDRYIPEMPDWQRDEVKAIIASMSSQEMTTIRSAAGERFALMRGEQGEPILVLFNMQHQGKQGQYVPFQINEESDGTQRLIHLLPALFGLRQEQERVVIIDEMDSRLHPLLTRLFVQSALDGASENPQSQLIFTTHDTNLLDLDLLRRDEIWFAEKDKDGASHLYSLAEFKIRPDLKIEKGYLNGRFGAIPFIGDPSPLGLSGDPEQEVKEERRYDLKPVVAAA